MDSKHSTITRFFEALSAFDTDAMGVLLAKDATIKSAGAPAYYGSEAAPRAIGDLSRSYTAFVAEPSRCLYDGDAAVVEWTALVTDFGGGQNKLDGCAVFDFDGDLVKSARFYWRPEDMHN